MPEIYEAILEFGYILKLFAQNNDDSDIQIIAYEKKVQEEMLLNRFKLFGYQKETTAV